MTWTVHTDVDARVLLTAIDRMRPAWQRRAACRGTEHGLFFNPNPSKQAEAKAICAACPVQPECLAHAMDQPERVGVWAGTNERERQRLRGERQRERRAGPSEEKAG